MEAKTIERDTVRVSSYGLLKMILMAKLLSRKAMIPFLLQPGLKWQVETPASAISTPGKWCVENQGEK